MKARIPYFDFYPVDFMNGVRGLSAQEVGVYTMVLCRIYEENGPIEYNTMRLSTYCGMRQTTFQKTVERLIDLGKFKLSSGILSNDRAEREISSRADKLKLNSKAGKASAKKRQQKQAKASTDVQRTFNHTDTDTDTDTIKDFSPPLREREPVGTQDDFEAFWQAYPHKVQQPSARGAYQFACLRASPAEILAGAIRYARKMDDRPWMNPAKWLSEDCWNDQPAQPPPKQSSMSRTEEAGRRFFERGNDDESDNQASDLRNVLQLPTFKGS
jgi:uncharacterized protein YdaU (DUF1376 family)